MMVKKQLSAEVEVVFENYAASWWQADYTSDCILDCTPN
jgi:hypothetical protein